VVDPVTGVEERLHQLEVNLFEVERYSNQIDLWQRIQ